MFVWFDSTFRPPGNISLKNGFNPRLLNTAGLTRKNIRCYLDCAIILDLLHQVRRNSYLVGRTKKNLEEKNIKLKQFEFLIKKLIFSHNERKKVNQENLILINENQYLQITRSKIICQGILNFKPRLENLQTWRLLLVLGPGPLGMQRPGTRRSLFVHWLSLEKSPKTLSLNYQSFSIIEYWEQKFRQIGNSRYFCSK